MLVRVKTIISVTLFLYFNLNQRAIVLNNVGYYIEFFFGFIYMYMLDYDIYIYIRQYDPTFVAHFRTSYRPNYCPIDFFRSLKVHLSKFRQKITIILENEKQTKKLKLSQNVSIKNCAPK